MSSFPRRPSRHVWLRRGILAITANIIMAVSGDAAEAPRPLLIAAASDLKFALDEVITAFQKAHPQHRPQPAYGSSGTLFAQIENGAPFDVFLSADVSFPRRLAESGRAQKESLFLYATGHLVVWIPETSPLDLAQLGARALLDPRIRKVAIANPEVAPYGAAAVAALRHLGMHDALQAKLVRGENVAQAAQFVQSGAADAGIISLSLALSPKMKDGRRWEVPPDSFPVLEQAAIICNKGANPEGAKAFCEFLRGVSGRAILQRYGFSLPGPSR
jgi:molybdate transport system substrate-binding protein